jgi:hypothetical protein
MKTFYCDDCGSLLFFENVQCVKCEHTLGFLPDIQDLSALEPASPERWHALASPDKGAVYRQCQNYRDHNVCNWCVPAGDQNAFCLSCRMDTTIPDLSVTPNLERWRKIETAKRRLIYTLRQLQLPLEGRGGRPPLRFSFLADVPGSTPVLSGHDNGLITLNIAEADDAEREKRRVNLHEPYRTVLGHFRHESGHYYWDQLIANTPRLARFRELFGDETQDYTAALKKHYEQGEPADWQTHLISAYASSHPWEDWAETWAHYLHITDTIETAAGFGISLAPRHPAAKAMTSDAKKVAGAKNSFDEILKNWFPLTYALNALNRGMGLPDLYPFVLSDSVVQKLNFIHETVMGARKNYV